MYFDLGETRHLASVVRSTDSEGEEVVSGLFDGKPISDTNIKRLYSRILSLLITDETEQIDTETTEPTYTFTLNLIDGTSNTLKLYQLNERQYACGLNDDPVRFYTNVSYVKDIVEAVDMLYHNEDLPQS